MGPAHRLAVRERGRHLAHGEYGTGRSVARRRYVRELRRRARGGGVRVPRLGVLAVRGHREHPAGRGGIRQIGPGRARSDQDGIQVGMRGGRAHVGAPRGTLLPRIHVGYEGVDIGFPLRDRGRISEIRHPRRHRRRRGDERRVRADEPILVGSRRVLRVLQLRGLRHAREGLAVAAVGASRVGGRDRRGGRDVVQRALQLPRRGRRGDTVRSDDDGGRRRFFRHFAPRRTREGARRFPRSAAPPGRAHRRALLRRIDAEAPPLGDDLRRGELPQHRRDIHRIREGRRRRVVGAARAPRAGRVERRRGARRLGARVRVHVPEPREPHDRRDVEARVRRHGGAVDVHDAVHVGHEPDAEGGAERGDRRGRDRERGRAVEASRAEGAGSVRGPHDRRDVRDRESHHGIRIGVRVALFGAHGDGIQEEEEGEGRLRGGSLGRGDNDGENDSPSPSVGKIHLLENL